MSVIPPGHQTGLRSVLGKLSDASPPIAFHMGLGKYLESGCPTWAIMTFYISLYFQGEGQNMQVIAHMHLLKYIILGIFNKCPGIDI